MADRQCCHIDFLPHSFDMQRLYIQQLRTKKNECICSVTLNCNQFSIRLIRCNFSQRNVSRECIKRIREHRLVAYK